MTADQSVYLTQLVNGENGTRSHMFTGTRREICDIVRAYKPERHEMDFVLVLLNASVEAQDAFSETHVRYPLMHIKTFLENFGEE